MTVSLVRGAMLAAACLALAHPVLANRPRSRGAGSGGLLGVGRLRDWKYRMVTPAKGD